MGQGYGKKTHVFQEVTNVTSLINVQVVFFSIQIDVIPLYSSGMHSNGSDLITFIVFEKKTRPYTRQHQSRGVGRGINAS